MNAFTLFAITTILAAATTTTASANSFLEKMQGDWRGKGTITVTGNQPSKDPLACRMSAKYDPSGKSLTLSGRCGSISGSRKFSTTLHAKSDGMISGKPILQKGNTAKINLIGRARDKSLKLTGSNNNTSLYVTLILQGKQKFQSQSGQSSANGNTSVILVNWTRQ